MFQKIKNKVQTIIQNKNIEEVNERTNNKNIGIYMIYIDNFEDNNIIPIYIGQTGAGKDRNFQNRYKEHLQEIMALNRLEYDYYKLIFFDNFYDGHFKACKIFQYMVDHECTLKDFHMVVLENLDTNLPKEELKELLNQKEQDFFKEFLPAFFGFNQINTVIQGNLEVRELMLKQSPIVYSDKLVQYDIEDSNNFLKYFGYGYTKFNYYHCYPKSPIIDDDDKRLTDEYINNKKLLISKYIDENKFKIYDEKKPKLYETQKKINEEIAHSKTFFKEHFEPQIEEYCQENNISIIHKYESIVDTVIYQNKERIEAFNNYLKRKKINTSIINIFNEKNDFISWREKYLNNLEKEQNIAFEIKECISVRRIDDLKRIFPQKQYNVLPLKDRYKEIEFGDLRNNELFINIEFSNNGLGYWSSYYNLIKMDYKFRFNEQIIEKKNIFINPQHKDDDEDDELDYFEKDRGAIFPVKREPFCVRTYKSNYISTTMELLNGINEYTLMNKNKYELNDILNEINALINPYTDVKVCVRHGMKNKCKQFLDDYYKTNNLLKYKMLLALE